MKKWVVWGGGVEKVEKMKAERRFVIFGGRKKKKHEKEKTKEKNTHTLSTLGSLHFSPERRTFPLRWASKSRRGRLLGLGMEETIDE